MRLSVPDRIFLLPPVGLGDFMAWLPVLRAIQVINPDVRFLLPSRYQKFSSLYETSFLPVAWVPQYEQEVLSKCKLALLLSDEEGDYQDHAVVLRKMLVRTGLSGGRYRRLWLTHRIAPAIIGFPRHESLRNLRLLKLFGLSRKVRMDSSSARLDHGFLFDSIQNQSVEKPYVVLHPYSNGHAREWPVQNYIELAKGLFGEGYRIVLTGSHDEGERLDAFIHSFPEGTINMCGQLNLKGLLQILAHASLVIAASTGPLHLSAALGTKTLGLYVPRKGMGPDRWGPIGVNAYYLNAIGSCKRMDCDANSCQCMEKLVPESIKAIILYWHKFGAPRLIGDAEADFLLGQVI
jgi:ADP-heptose:LPS heptosyltransferase